MMELSRSDRVQFICTGLDHLGDRLRLLVAEIEEHGPGIAGELLVGVAGEEAGKALILLDVYRSPGAPQAKISRQLGRASQHLPKLLYRQMVDFRIASQEELVAALHQYRLERYLDGPNDVDWIFRNSLIAERENELYVDVVRTESGLEWWPPLPADRAPLVPDAARLVLALQDAGLFCPEGLARLSAAWADFDASRDSRFSDWAARTAAVLESAPKASLAVARELWPMPMTELDLESIPVSDDEIAEAREYYS